jgi:hypothetical protein
MVLPLPRFVLRPTTAALVAAVHIYLAAGHLWQLAVGDVQWTHCWKGFGALGGAYVFTSLASAGPTETIGRAYGWTRKDTNARCSEAVRRRIPVAPRRWNKPFFDLFPASFLYSNSRFDRYKEARSTHPNLGTP